MKLRFRLFIVFLVLLLVTSIGINIVTAVSTDTPEPGSDQDPLISKSYVDSIVNTYNAKLQQLQSKYEDTEKKLSLQDEKIKDLQTQVAALKSGGSGNAQSTGKTDTKPQSNQQNSSATKATKKGTINASALNIRVAANTTAKIAGKALKGETVEILSESNGWYKVKTAKGVTGWGMATYITVK